MQDKEGKFVPAKPVPGTVCINVGDLLQQWTNDVSFCARRVSVGLFKPLLTYLALSCRL